MTGACRAGRMMRAGGVSRFFQYELCLSIYYMYQRQIFALLSLTICCGNVCVIVKKFCFKTLKIAVILTIVFCAKVNKIVEMKYCFFYRPFETGSAGFYLIFSCVPGI